jgi:hypothetical protein
MDKKVNKSKGRMIKIVNLVKTKPGRSRIKNLKEAKEPLKERVTPQTIGSYTHLIALELESQKDAKVIKALLEDQYASELANGDIYFLQNGHFILTSTKAMMEDITSMFDEQGDYASRTGQVEYWVFEQI